MSKFLVKEGDYADLGTKVNSNYVIFTFFAEKEDECYILLMDLKAGSTDKIAVPDLYCRGSLRSVAIQIPNVKEYSYQYEINGKILMDEYARVIHGRENWMDFSRADRDYALSGGFLTDGFLWEEDIAPEIPRENVILYKLHLRGYTMDKGVAKKHAGTFAGLIDKIPYLKSLGVTTVEVMPIYEFEEMTIPVKHELPDYVKWKMEEHDLIAPLADEPEVSDKVNFWGYGPGNYFAVKASYATKPELASYELKKLISCLHKENMELVMEMFFPQQTNYQLILNALRFWVLEYHVDGFHLLGDDLPIKMITTDAILTRTKLFYVDFDYSIAENRKHKNLYISRDEYQYPAKKLINHMNADMVEFMNQQRKQGIPYGYINYLTGNNGFTLADLFMYNDRHNEANGENNNDGNPWNFSNNYGVEGPTKKKAIIETRRRQWRNAFTMLLMAQAVPMIWSGDEFENSQNGNNNAYCQDNSIGWINWKNNMQSKADIDFVKALIAFRKNHPIVSNRVPFTYSDYRTLGAPDLSIHGEYAWVTDQNPGNLALGLLYCGAYSSDSEKTEDVYIGYNFYATEFSLALPRISNEKKWYLAVNTADGKTPYLTEPILCESQHKVQIEPQSICIFVGK